MLKATRALIKMRSHCKVDSRKNVEQLMIHLDDCPCIDGSKRFMVASSLQSHHWNTPTSYYNLRPALLPSAGCVHTPPASNTRVFFRASSAIRSINAFDSAVSIRLTMPCSLRSHRMLNLWTRMDPEIRAYNPWSNLESYTERISTGQQLK